MTPELDLILRIIVFVIVVIAIVVSAIVNYYILKALKSVSKAFDSLYAVVESIDAKLQDIKEEKRK